MVNGIRTGWWLAPFVGAALASAVAQASEQGEAFEIDSVQVSATRSQTSLANSPRTVSVISAEEVAERVGSGGIQGLLESIPGIEFSRSGGLGGQIVMRGFNSNTGRTILAIDGERYRGRSTLEFNMIDPESIERIEIIRGPASALYGSDAMNGVVNIVTRRSKTDPDGEFSLAPRLRALQWESGSDMVGGRAELVGGGNGFDVLIGVHDRQAGDYDSPLGTALNSGYHMQGLDFNLGYSPTDESRWELSGRYEYVSTERAGGLGAAPGLPYLDVEEDPIVERYLRLGYEGENFGRWADSLNAGLYVRDFETDIYQVNATSAAATANAHIRVYSPTVWGGHLTAMKTLGDHQLSYGGDFYNEAFEGRTRNIQRYSTSTGALLADTGWSDMERDSEQLNLGLYINDDWTVNEQWSLSGALRGDYVAVEIGDAIDGENVAQQEAFDGNTDKNYTALTGSVGAIYRLTPDWHLVGNLSRGFRAPSGMNMTITSVAGTVTTLPSPELEEETNLTAELGLRWYGDNSELQLTAYQSRYKDLIALVAVGTDLYQRQNISDATISGVELDGRTRLDDNWSLNYALATTRGTDDSNDQPLAYIAPLSGRVALRYEGNDWFGQGSVRGYQGKTRIDASQERETGSYAVVDLQAGMSLARVLGAGWHDWTLVAGVENLFDRVGRNPTVVESLSYSNNLLANPLVEPGRSVMLKLTVDY